MLEIEALSAESLLDIEHDFCRARRRKDYWRKLQPGKVSAHGAIGRLVKLMTDRRNQLVREQLEGARETASQDQQEPQKKASMALLTQKLMSDLLRVPAPRLGEFLNGTPNKREEWTRIGYLALRALLCGTRSLEDMEASQRAICQRILDFFFPMGAVEEQGCTVNRMDGMIQHRDHPELWQPWYFSASIHSFEDGVPESLMEVEAELRAFAHAARHRGVKGRIVRVSGTGRFRQIEDDFQRLTVNGELTLDCLAVGIPLIFLLPDCGETSQNLASWRSANAFKSIVRDRFPDNSSIHDKVRVLPLEPSVFREVNGDRRYAFEYFSADLRWQFYDRDDHQHCLIVSRDSSLLSPSLFAPRGKEVQRFREWLDAFVDQV